MKTEKSLLVIAFCIFLCTFLGSQTITISSPNGGENWVSGTTQNIVWNSSGVISGKFVVLLFEGSRKIGTVKTGILCGNGRHSITWTVGNLRGGNTAPNGSNYKIKVRQASAAPKDFSDLPFTISADVPQSPSEETLSPSIIVYKPDGGERWLINGPQKTITWRGYSISSGLFEISLWEGNVNKGIIATGRPWNTYTYKWTVGVLANGTTVPINSKYMIKVQWIGQNVFDFSNRIFELFSLPSSSPAPLFEVYQPEQNRYAMVGENLEIKWGIISRNMRKISPSQDLKKAKKQPIVLEKGVRIEIKSVACPDPVSHELNLRNFYLSNTTTVQKFKIEKLIAKPWGVGILQWKEIINNTFDDGYYKWRIPTGFKKGCYVIRVTKLKGENIKAESKVFKIVPSVEIDKTVEVVK